MYSVTESIIDWLCAYGYRASTRVPKNPPDEFVTVERTGGNLENFVDYPTFAIQAWAPTEARAEEIATEIRNHAIMDALPRGVHSMRVNSGAYPFFDESTRCPRYQIVFDVAAKAVD